MPDQRKYEDFRDGIAEVCLTNGRNIVKTKLKALRVGYRTVGVKRFYEAKVESNLVDLLVSTPLNRIVARDDVLITAGKQYRIIQVQYKYDSLPPCCYLSLERIAIPYKDERKPEDGKQ